MSLHSYSKCWLHLVWGTLKREKLITGKEERKRVSSYLYDYAKAKNIFMKINYVNVEHVHSLVDLPTNLCIEEMMHLLKGSSSHWINQNNICHGKFAWGRGYAALSVSESNLQKVAKYIENQGEHHKVKSFNAEYEQFIKAYGMKYVPEEV
ncbi:MAG: IS200/IS605 family transposase [Ignavibacteriaceae bacterium]